MVQSGFYWPVSFKDAHSFVIYCNGCQRSESISRRQEMPLHKILEVDLFDVLDIDFMAPFIPSNQNQFILAIVDYVSKLVEATTFPTNDAKVLIKFLKKNIFTRFRTPRAIISGMRSHFYNQAFETLMAKYGLKHRTATA